MKDKKYREFWVHNESLNAMMQYHHVIVSEQHWHLKENDIALNNRNIFMHVIEYQAYEDLKKENEKLKDALSDAVDYTSSHLEDMQHYFENKCISTSDEVNQCAIIDSQLRIILNKYLKFKYLKESEGE